MMLLGVVVTVSATPVAAHAYYGDNVDIDNSSNVVINTGDHHHERYYHDDVLIDLL